jgi:hypothetical protein
MTTSTETTIETDPTLPIIRITRDFAAASGQLFRAHTDPVLFAQRIGARALRGVVQAASVAQPGPVVPAVNSQSSPSPQQ